MAIGHLIGRLLTGAFYLYSGYNHFASLSGLTQAAASKGVPLPQVAVIGAGVVLLVAGASILTGWKPRIGIAAVVLFFVPINLMMHNFWALEGAQAAEQQSTFFKNTALMGSVLVFLAIPRPWPLSLDRKPPERGVP